MTATPARPRRRWPLIATVLVVAVVGSGLAIAVTATGTVREIGSDPYTNPDSQHRTAVEPDTFSFGGTIVSAFQVGRYEQGGGSSNIAWATATGAGGDWSHGYLPSLTVHSSPAGRYQRASDPSVGYDARHRVWLIASVALTGSGGGTKAAAIVVSRSTTGGRSWTAPVSVALAGGASEYDKSWVACDNTETSPVYGNCYAVWDDSGKDRLLLASTSTDGGETWSAPTPTVHRVTGLGVQPVVRPDGTVVVVVVDTKDNALVSYRSTDGGRSWSATTRIAEIRAHPVAGGLRARALPSAEVDGDGRVYVAWQDCRFRAGCGANDIVFASSADGVAWSPVTKVAINDGARDADHFLPGLAVDPASRGEAARLAVTYYFYPAADCSFEDCELQVGAVASVDAGRTWSVPIELDRGPMSLRWLPKTTLGRMVGDYISTSFVDGTPVGVFAVAQDPSGTPDAYRQAMHAATIRLVAAPRDGRTPDDPLFARWQWGPRHIRAPVAWGVSTGAGVTIAVVDSGVDLDHPDLAGKLVPGATFLDCPQPGRSCGDGDWESGPADRRASAFPHGTHVAGIAAAATNNGIGIAGVAPDAAVLPVKVGDGARIDLADVARGIRFAVDRGADVVNLSLSERLGSEFLTLLGGGSELVEAVRHAVSRGVVVVAAAGNGAYPLCESPSAVEGVVA